MRRRKEKSNMKKLYYDAVIIGFDKGGKTLAGKAKWNREAVSEHLSNEK